MRSRLLSWFLCFFALFGVTGVSFAAYSVSDTSSSSEFFDNNYLDPSCHTQESNGGDSSSRGFSAQSAHPLAARVVECIEGTMQGMFLNVNPSQKATLFQSFQRIVQGLVSLCLILYIMSIGYSMATGQYFGASDSMKKDFLFFIIKFALVYYFAVGDAWKDIFFVALRSISATFGGILISAATGNQNYDGCLFPPGLYHYSKTYVSIFDTMDCKFGNYIGWFRGQPFPLLIVAGFSYLVFPPMIGPAVTVLSAVFCLQIIALASRIAQLYLVSITVLTLLVFASPLIVPLCLFDYTQQMFKRWLSKIVAMAMHPVLAFAFMGVLITITDSVFYGEDPVGNLMFTDVNNLEDNTLNSVLANNVFTDGEDTILKNEKPDLYQHYKTEGGFSAFRERLSSVMALSKRLSGDELKKAALQTFFPGSDFGKYKKMHDGGLPQSAEKLPQDAMLSSLSRLKGYKPKFFREGDGDTIQDNLTTVNAIGFDTVFSMSDSQLRGVIERRFQLASDLAPWIEGRAGQAEKFLEKMRRTGGMFNSTHGRGAYVNRHCWGGSSFPNYWNVIGSVPIVCVIAWVASQPVTLALPLPGLIEVFKIYFHFRIDLALFLAIKLLMVIILTFILMVVFEQIEPMIDKLTGEQIRDLGSYITAVDIVKASKSTAQKANEFTKKASAKDGEKRDQKSGGGGVDAQGEGGRGGDGPGGGGVDAQGGG